MTDAAHKHLNSRRPTASAKASGRLCVIAAAILWSTSGLFAKAPLFEDWPADVRGPALAFWRAAFAAVVVLPLVRRPRFRRGMVPMALAFAAMNLSFMSGMVHTTAANTIWLQSTAPLWVFVIGALVLHESATRGDLTLLGFGAVGIALILTCELSQSSPVMNGQSSALGVLFGLASGAAYGGVVLSLRHLRAENGALLVAVNQLATAALLAPFVVYVAVERGVWPTPLQLAVLAGFGVFQMALPYLLFARGLQSVSSHEAAGLTLLEPVLNPLCVYLAWSEQPAWWTIAGAALILSGLAVKYRMTNP